MVRKFKDASDMPNVVQELCHSVFRGIATLKLKEPKKFAQRLGREYEQFYEELKFPDELKDEILRDDDFFNLTLELQKKFKR